MKLHTTALVLGLGLALFLPARLCAQHGHLSAGAVSTNQNAQLIWANGADFVASSGYVKTLEYTNEGRFAGYYQGGITPTALPATATNGGPSLEAAAFGSYLYFSLSCLSGPPGGSFNFWEAGSTTPSLSLLSGEIGTNLWRLSEGEGGPGADPYGHLHGRRFTATKPGVYKIGFIAHDKSTNGVSGGPIHRPSAELAVQFQAGVNIISVDPDEKEGRVHVRFGAWAGFSWQVEWADEMSANPSWLPVGDPIIGNDYFVETIHGGPTDRQRFYRVKGTVIDP